MSFHLKGGDEKEKLKERSYPIMRLQGMNWDTKLGGRSRITIITKGDGIAKEEKNGEGEKKKNVTAFGLPLANLDREVGMIQASEFKQ
jgi:hypothetical protein